jgi:hypothetical protein
LENSYIGKEWKIAITIVISLIVIYNLPGKNDSDSTSKSTAETTLTEQPELKKEWVELIRFKGNGDKKSQTFTYNGGEARIRYDFKTGAYAGVLSVYVVPKGVDVMREGGFPEVMITDTEVGESNLSHLRKGEYYLNIMSANGQYDIIIEEYK